MNCDRRYLAQRLADERRMAERYRERLAVEDRPDERAHLEGQLRDTLAIVRSYEAQLAEPCGDPECVATRERLAALETAYAVAADALLDDEDDGLRDVPSEVVRRIKRDETVRRSAA